MNYRLDISYDGRNYHGFQTQLHHRTVQKTLEQKLSKLLGIEVNINASGRTDTGVHALVQTVNFKAEVTIPPDKLKYALNHALPEDIAILNVQKVAEDFHARISAVRKTYTYKILLTEEKKPFLSAYYWQVRHQLNVEDMRKATQCLLGENDFTSFRSTGSVDGSAVRRMDEAYWIEKENPTVLEFVITGNGFLYHMVRNIVGMLVQVGRGRLSVEDFERFLHKKERVGTCHIAPPQGLYLVEVEYGN